MVIARPLFPWLGSKEKLAPFLQQILPPDTTRLTEVFGGSGALLLFLPPKPGRLDVYNDLNNNLFNTFCCVREKMAALIRELRFFPIHGRVPFEFCRNIMAHETDYHRHIREEQAVLEDPENPCGFTPEQIQELCRILSERDDLFDVQRAAAFLFTAYGCYSANIKSFGLQTVDVKAIVDRLEEAAARVQSLVLENRDALDLIARCGRRQAIYADPPYFKAEKCYDVLFLQKQHQVLRDALRQCPGYVILSYNNCPQMWGLYQEDFFILALTRDNPLAQKPKSTYRELIITNYDPRPYLNTQMDLLDPASGPKWEPVLLNIPARFPNR